MLSVSLLEYTITMYDTKSRELRWNATYSDYASTLPDDDTKYSKILEHAGSGVALVSDAQSPPLVCLLVLRRDGSFRVQR